MIKMSEPECFRTFFLSRFLITGGLAATALWYVRLPPRQITQGLFCENRNRSFCALPSTWDMGVFCCLWSFAGKLEVLPRCLLSTYGFVLKYRMEFTVIRLGTAWAVKLGYR